MEKMPLAQDEKLGEDNISVPSSFDDTAALIEPFPRINWSWDATDEMLFELCPQRFKDQSLETRRQACIVKYNPLYWIVFFVIFISLWLGREFHILFGQGGPVRKDESSPEYNVRVQWVYSTSGQMILVFLNCVVTVLSAIVGAKINAVSMAVNFVVVVGYCVGNAVLLRMMRLRHLAGTRVIIVSNGIFSLSMLSSLICYSAEVIWRLDELSANKAMRKVFVVLNKSIAVLFIVAASLDYCNLWYLYKYDGRDMTRRMCETLPAVLSACAMMFLMYLGFLYDSSEFEPYIWAAFT